MGKPLISICIPTYNRAPFLRECLTSITSQFNDEKIKEKVNIKILDNQSADNTKKIVKKFTDIFDNIEYVEDDEKRGIAGGLTKVATLADGEYIWFFSDDDLHAKNSLKTAMDFIEKNRTDLILTNLLGFNDKDDVKYLNLLKIDNDIIIKNRHDFFNLINKKFYNYIDYYTTFCSNWILKTEIFKNNFDIINKFNGKYDLFPFTSAILYTKKEFNVGIITDQIVFNRGDNENWRKKNVIKQFFYKNSIWRNYYKKIIENNKNYLPKYFVLKVKVKNLLRFKELIKILLVMTLRKIGVYNYIKKIINKK